MRWATFTLVLAACQSERVESPATSVAATPPAVVKAAPKETFSLSSAAFEHGGSIPGEYTADGRDISPPLSWSGAPVGTKALVLIMDDPDAPVGTWDHWVVYDLPGSTTSLAKGASKALPAGAKDGTNSWGRTGYGGPAPPPGKPHRYFFQLYALGEPLGLEAGKKKKAVQTAMQGRVLAEASWMGTYQR